MATTGGGAVSAESEESRGLHLRDLWRAPLRFVYRLVFGLVACAVLAALAWYAEAYNELLGNEHERATGLSAVTPLLLTSRGVSVDMTRVQKPSDFAPHDGFLTIRTAALSIVAQDFDTAKTKVERITIGHSGYVAEITVRASEGERRELHSALRIPAAQLDAALQALKTLGRVENESQSSAEVSEQSADLDASLRNSKVTEKRLLDLLRSRASKIEDIVAAEKELANTRENVERLERQRISLDHRIQFSSVELLVHEPSAESAVSTAARLQSSLSSGVRILEHSLLGTLLWIIQLGPTLCVWLALLFWPARIVWRRIRAASQQARAA